MLSKYFKFKIATKQFEEDINGIFEKIRGKEILLCVQAKDELMYLDKKYKIFDNLNITGLSLYNKKEKFNNIAKNIKLIDFDDIKNAKFDVIFVLSANATRIIDKIRFKLMVEDREIYTPFIEYVKEEKENLEYLLKHNFTKTLPRLINKLKNKKVVLYGAGVFFELIDKYFDLSELNVIGLSDYKLRYANDTKISYMNYPICHPNDIVKIKPDYVVITLKRYYPMQDAMNSSNIRKKGIKIISVVKKNLFEKFIDFADS